jgi:hypothetical protein
MTPERAAALVARWVRLYTSGLPAVVAQRRIEEIDADLHDHIAHERSRGTSNGRIARGIASRMVRGAAADVAWREHTVNSAKEKTMESVSLGRSVVRVTVVVLAILAIPLIAMLFSDGVAWGVFDFVLAGTLLAVVGASFEIAARRGGNVVMAGGLALLGVAAAVVGELDDAPGLIVVGALLVAGGAAVMYRRMQGAG